jgi:uncharacterized membrane protein
MTANPWILSLHLIALFLWLGYLLVLPRLLAHAASLPDDARSALAARLRRGWNTASPVGLVVLVTGLMMLHGVGSASFASVGDALRHYFKPTLNGEPTFWYVTFHVKLVSFTLLSGIDFWLGMQAGRMAKGVVAKRAWPLALLLAPSCALLLHVTVWLSLSALGLGPAARFIGYAFAVLGVGLGVLAARKLGTSDAPAKYHLAHGVVAALLVLIVILIVAKPLSFAGPTLS